MMKLSGIIPPVATPLTESGELDFESLDRVVDSFLDAGLHGLFVQGSTGEVAYLTDEQRDQIIARVSARANGRVPVVAGCIDMTASRVIAGAKRAADAGADYVVATAPFYAINSDAEIRDHFRMIAAGSPVPVVAYDVPVRVHSKLTVPTLIELGREGTICAVKDSSGDDVSFRRLIAANAAAGSPLSVLSGHEVVLDGIFLMGADGAVPGLANVCPVEYGQLWAAAQAGDWVQARAIQDRISAIFEIVFQTVGRSGDAAGVGAFKAAMHALGVISTPTMCRPVEALSGEPVAKIRAILAAQGLL